MADCRSLVGWRPLSAHRPFFPGCCRSGDRSLPARHAGAWPALPVTVCLSRPENNVPPFARSKYPSLLLSAPVKVPFMCPKKSVGCQFLGKDGAVDGHQRFFLAVAGVMYPLCDGFLAGSVRPENKHGYVKRGDRSGQGSPPQASAGCSCGRGSCPCHRTPGTRAAICP